MLRKISGSGSFVIVGVHLLTSPIHVPMIVILTLQEMIRKKVLIISVRGMIILNETSFVRVRVISICVSLQFLLRRISCQNMAASSRCEITLRDRREALLCTEKDQENVHILWFKLYIQLRIIRRCVCTRITQTSTNNCKCEPCTAKIRSRRTKRILPTGFWV